MELIDVIIKQALREDLKGQILEKAPNCPSELELAGYITGCLSLKRKAEVSSHLNGCMACLEDLVLAEKVNKTEEKMELTGKDMPKNWLKKNVWLFLAIISFVASFVYSRYFLQFLVATLVLAAKWIFESVNARMLIMIYEAWNRGGEKEVTKVMERVSNRL